MSNAEPSRFDPERQDRAYEKYVANCRRLGIEPMSWERVRAQTAEWLRTLAGGDSDSPTARE